MSLFCRTQKKLFWRMWKQSSSGAPLTSIVFYFPTMEVNGAPKQPGYKLSSKYLILCSSEKRYSYRVGTTWVNDDIILICGGTIPLIVRIGLCNKVFLNSALKKTAKICCKLETFYQKWKSMPCRLKLDFQYRESLKHKQNRRNRMINRMINKRHIGR